MSTPSFVPTWWRSKSNLKPMPRQHEPLLSESQRTFLKHGLLLLIGIVLILALSACQPLVIRQACDPYPPLPENLRNHSSGNLDLVPQSMLPSAKTDSTKP